MRLSRVTIKIEYEDVVDKLNDRLGSYGIDVRDVVSIQEFNGVNYAYIVVWYKEVKNDNGS